MIYDINSSTKKKKKTVGSLEIKHVATTSIHMHFTMRLSSAMLAEILFNAAAVSVTNSSLRLPWMAHR